MTEKYVWKDTGKLGILNFKPNFSFTFNRGNEKVGALDFNGPEMTFSGDMDESAKLFLELVATSFKTRLEQERAEEREACIKIVENEAMQYAEPVWAFEIVNDIKARGHVATNDTSQKRVDKTSEIVHEPWSPVSIGVDITKEGAHVVGIYALDKDTSQVFYAKYYPAPQRTWVGLTFDERLELADDVDWPAGAYCEYAEKIEAKLKEKNI